MKEKVILVSVDGMRPDGALACGHPFVGEMMERGACTLASRTVFPSVTLPCHMSMFHSVPPERHGITTNLYMPLARPLPGLAEQIARAGGVCAMYYNWEPMRDVARPGSMKYAEFIECYSAEGTDGLLADAAIARIRASAPDFVYLYMVETDDKGGHDHGWMTPEYLGYVRAAIDSVRRVWEAAGGEYTMLVTADHGGHDRSHGTELPEDMTVPLFCLGPRFTPGRTLTDVTILDVAPTVADVMGVAPAPEWEGRSLAQ